MTTLKEEEPFAAAVKTVCLDTTCSHCFFNDGSDPAFRPPENVVHKCLGCHTVSYCDRKCQKSDWANHKNECRLLKQLNEKMKPIPEADVRLVARILLKSDEELATKAFNGCTWDSLENHATSGSPEFRNKIDSIIDFIKPLKTLSSEEVTKAFCKVATNRLDIIESRHGIGHVGIGIYLGLSVHKHNCLPDAQVIFNGTTALLRPFDEDPDYSTEFLAARSAFFAALFTSNFKEKNAERIVIDANSLAFQRLLSILYNSSCDCENLFDCNAYKKLLIRPSELNRRLWNEVEELFELADRFLVLDLVRGVFETHLIVADLKCPNARPDCYHCAMKLLVALRFNLEEYKKLNVSARMTIKEALVRLNVIVKEHPWSTDAMIWLMDRK